jgi:hypothetical protein
MLNAFEHRLNFMWFKLVKFGRKIDVLKDVASEVA